MNTLRNGLSEYADETVISPAWPFAVWGTDWSGPVTGGSSIGFSDDFSDHAINPETPSDWDWVAPLIVGRLELDLPSLLNPEVAAVQISLVEDATAEHGLTPVAASWSTGPALNDTTTPPIFPFSIEWSQRPRSSAPRVEIARKSLGFAPRSRASAAYPQQSVTAVSGSVSMVNRVEISKLLRWWGDIGGPSGAHYATTLAHVTGVAEDVAAAATSIVVEDASELGPYRFLSIDNGSVIQWVRVLSIASNTLTLSAGIEHAIKAGGATVSVAVLARHVGDEFELEFRSPEFATARLEWEEVPEEYSMGTGETRGTTIGAVALKAWLYKITVDRLGTPTVYRRASYEQNLTVSGDTWTAAPITHSEFERSIRLDRDEITIEARAEAWANVFLPGNLTARVLIEISECSVSGSTGSNVVSVWSGEISRISFDGPFVKAAAVGPYSVFDRQVPRIVVQPACTHAVYDAGCGLISADWTFTAAVNSTVTSNMVDLKTMAKSGGLPPGWGFVHYFALGYLSRGSERWLVLASSAVSGGLVTLTLDRAATWTVDDAVSVVPGCDGRPETCRPYNVSTNPTGKFNNFAKFLGFPFAPQKNPSFTIPKQTQGSYGKK